jgi:TonB family protein
MSTTSSVQWFARADRTLGSQPVALEVGVEVSGTRAANDRGTRELFSETTLTTLVFEDGAVVRLSAPVADGQLLFLKHRKSSKEIVTRVLKQRTFGTANAYVELEFTETAPEFWGVELGLARSETTERTPAEVAARELLADDAAEHGSQAAAAMPDEGEVSRLREEIAALRSQMGSLLEGAARPAEATAPVAAAADTSSVITTLLGAGPKAPDAASADARDRKPVEPESLSDAGVELLPGNRITIPVRLLAGMLALALVSGVAYQKGIFRGWFGKSQAAGSDRGVVQQTSGNQGAVSRSRPGGISPAVTAAKPAMSGTSKMDSSTPSRSQATAASGGHDMVATNVAMHESEAREERSSVRTRQASDAAAAVSRREHRAESSDVADSAGPAIADGAEEVVEPPSLIKSVNAVPPPEAVRQFVTGDVKFDALIDSKGRVSSASVLSGPTPLRAAALEALHGYQYKPATKNGQAVSAHVSVTVKFWYEP